jgi:hypothetical protein
MGIALITIAGSWIVAPSLKLVGIGIVWLASQTLGSLWVAWDSGAGVRVMTFVRAWVKREANTSPGATGLS